MRLIRAVLILLLLPLSCIITNPKTKADAFVHLRDKLSVTVGDVQKSFDISTASGVCVVSKTYNNYTTILTTAHFCELDEDDKLRQVRIIMPFLTTNITDEVNIEINREIIATLLDGTEIKTQIIKSKRDKDLCLLQVLGDKVCMNHVFIADDSPELTEKLYNFSAPLSVFGPNNLLLFDGYYGGINIYGDMMFTIPATYGSSGSMVLNKNLKIVSILKLAMNDFLHVSVGVNLLDIQLFMNDK